MRWNETTVKKNEFDLFSFRYTRAGKEQRKRSSFLRRTTTTAALSSLFFTPILLLLPLLLLFRFSRSLLPCPAGSA